MALRLLSTKKNQWTIAILLTCYATYFHSMLVIFLSILPHVQVLVYDIKQIHAITEIKSFKALISWSRTWIINICIDILLVSYLPLLFIDAYPISQPCVPTFQSIKFWQCLWYGSSERPTFVLFTNCSVIKWSYRIVYDGLLLCWNIR